MSVSSLREDFPPKMVMYIEGGRDNGDEAGRTYIHIYIHVYVHVRTYLRLPPIYVSLYI